MNERAATKAVTMNVVTGLGFYVSECPALFEGSVRQ